MKRRRAILPTAIVVTLLCADWGRSQTAERPLLESLEGILKAQAESWNEGNIERFMQHYWKSEQLSFCSGGKRTFGWQKVYDGYKQRYATPEQMGQLAFSNLDIRPLGNDAALVLGDWQLTRKDDDPGGNFSLVFQRVEGRWVITHDHTSLRASAGE